MPPAVSRNAACRPRRLDKRLDLLACLLLGGCVDPVGSSLYQPQPIGAVAAWTGRAPAPVSARTADGIDLAGLFWAPRDAGGDILLFLPGRTGNLDTAARQAQSLAAGGRGVLVASYRGYGANRGTPSERGLYLDGAAFADLAHTLHHGGKLYLFGDGLGGAVALRTASRTDVSATVTLGAFDRFSSFAPPVMRGMYKDAFDNVAAIRKVRTPVLIMHGRKDEVVPFAAAEKLRQAAAGAAVVAPIDGEAYHSVDLRYLAPTVWRALDQMGTMGAVAKR